MTIPAIVLPMHHAFAGCIVAAHAYRAELNIVPGREALHDAHEAFFHDARTYLRHNQDAFLLVRGDEASVWTQWRGEQPAPRQAALPQTAPDIAGTLRRRAAAPLKPAKPQAPCDVGLFSDDARQIDLVDYANPEVIPASQCRKR